MENSRLREDFYKLSDLLSQNVQKQVLNTFSENGFL
jgi:hypothetical protein